MKKIVFRDDPNKYTVKELGLIFEGSATYEKQEQAALEFYNSVNLDEKQTDLLNSYIALRLDAENALVRFLKGYSGGDDIKKASEKSDTAKKDFLNAAALDENQMSLFERFTSLLGMSQNMYLDCIYRGINPVHFNKAPMLSFGEVLKRIRTEEGMTQAEMSETLCVSRRHISNLEAGRDKPSDMLLKLIFHEFNISFDFLKTSRDAA